MAPITANAAACSGPIATATHPAAAPATARKPNAIVRLWRHIAAVLSPRPYGDWSEAMTELKHLDSDTLRDVGAPPWLTHQIEVQREQDARALRMMHHR